MTFFMLQCVRNRWRYYYYYYYVIAVLTISNNPTPYQYKTAHVSRCGYKMHKLSYTTTWGQ